VFACLPCLMPPTVPASHHATKKEHKSRKKMLMSTHNPVSRPTCPPSSSFRPSLSLGFSFRISLAAWLCFRRQLGILQFCGNLQIGNLCVIMHVCGVCSALGGAVQVSAAQPPAPPQDESCTQVICTVTTATFSRSVVISSTNARADRNGVAVVTVHIFTTIMPFTALSGKVASKNVISKVASKNVISE